MSFKSICAVPGVKAWGVKEGKYGLALISASGTAAGVFTANLVRAAPIELMKKQMKAGRLEAVIANSGCANAYTGKRGYADAVTMTEYAGEALGIKPSRIGVASTGVIGRYLDLPLIKKQCGVVAPKLASTPEAEDLAEKAIMTTDLVPKHALVEREGFTIGGITKGSGMIAPNMGTMLAFIYTDADIGAAKLSEALKLATKRSFNRVVVDGDTSTNDIALCTATGEAGKVNIKEFSAALEECCRSLAKQIAADGEGASKLLEIVVKGAKKEDDAEKVARTVIESPLVKTAVYGEDPNWGRVVAAAGRAGVKFDPNAVSLWISDGNDRFPLVKSGAIIADLAAAKMAMRGKNVVFILDLDAGKAEATAWGCDLTEKYVEINGKYTT
ncbi:MULTISPECIES: bifunctional ornithine acetyltransferase/N-acetylglutamate synthase [unclassified Methanoregula]|uniref:bifunctional ornithine acetyltransferase/N-acetylglutamate synthase n=1 Tax=unclassified Methanoregula TaxID=2649730 RepID=UPI0009CD56DE|nr:MULTISPECIES: bifunctional ornithine acetyltransferase/N-acetylglutamate synthase [unclassified Methanoregula]OPX63172.1 MAG: Glutamate N-acetyltransferase [Methanoregula sp. PtaB.Bin085]OPY33472.1 MAG: Glutamate N-acetyltransferase [Methanoregula sp. PtaU1.Bin006]